MAQSLINGRTMNKTLYFLFLIIFAVLASGQTRRTTPPRQQPSAPRPARKVVETVRTPDGREVHLYDDMTYDIASVDTSRAPIPVTLNIKAGVITKSGDVKPVVRRDFSFSRKTSNAYWQLSVIARENLSMSSVFIWRMNIENSMMRVRSTPRWKNSSQSRSPSQPPTFKATRQYSYPAAKRRTGCMAPPNV